MPRPTALQVARAAAAASLCAVLISPPLGNATLLVCLAAFAASPEARCRFLAMLREPIGLAALVMLASLAVGLGYGINPLADGLQELLKNRFWIFLPVLACLFYEARAKRDFALAFVLFGGFAAVLSGLFWALDYSPTRNQPGIVLRDHATQGMALSIGAFMALFLLLHCRAQLSAPLRKLLMAAAALMVVNAIYISFGRAGHATLLLLALYAAWHILRSGGSRALAGGLLAAIALGLATSSTVQDRLKLGIDEMVQVDSTRSGTSMGNRVVFWENTLEMIRERPLLGYGTGAFDEAYAEKVKGVEGWRGQLSDDPHNQYLFSLAERGAIGLAALFAFLWLLVRQRGVGEPWRHLAIAVVLAWSVNNLVNSYFHTFNQATFFAIYIGVLLAPLGFPTRGARRRSSTADTAVSTG